MTRDWSTACPDWERRIIARQSLIPFDPLFPKEAEEASKVFRSLRIVDAPGSPTMEEACRPWVFNFADAVFGAYDPEGGRRLIREFMLLVSKKNAKSTTAAGIMLTALVRNWRMSGEFLILAPTIEIANNSFFPTRDMVRNDPELSDIMHVQEHYRTITHKKTSATLKVVAADDETVGGKKAIGVFVDELWLFGKRQKAENMLREATGGLASRPEGFVIYASTQADDPPVGVFKQKLQYARGVRDGRIKDKRFLPVLYEFPEAMLKDGSYRNKENFYITNPNLGASVDVEYIEREFDKATEAGEESLRGFLAKSLNVEIGLSLRSDRWPGAEFWEARADKSLTLESLLDRSEVAVVGIDGGGLDDLLGLAVLGREKGTRNWLLWSHAWAHECVLERRKEIASTLRDFEQEGTLTIVPDESSADIEGVADIVEQVNDAGLLPASKAIGVDPAGVNDIVDELELRGFDADPNTGRITGIRQGFYTLNNTTKMAERRLAAGTMTHSGTRMMAWCVGNAKVVPRGNAITIEKQAAGSAKIDPLMAGFNCIALMAMNPEADGGSVYEERGLRFA